MTILELREARVSVGSRVLLSMASLSMDPGQCVAVMGPSGSGKSTLLQTIAGIRAPLPDQVYVEGQDLGRMGSPARDHLRLSRMGMVFQFGEVLPELSAIENVALPSRYLGVARAAAHERAGRWLDDLGLSDLRNARPDQLSGGQIQRVAIARAMAHGPRLVLADEPTGMLDGSTSHDVVQLLVDCVKSSGAALVIVTHDQAVAAASDRVLSLADGRLAAA
jgi:ABC-type lipoprotein export system ATPase subunit